MFLLGAAVLGMKFALTTLVSTFYYPVILGVLEQIPALQNVTDDKMLSTICGGLMIGMGIGIVIRLSLIHILQDLIQEQLILQQWLNYLHVHIMEQKLIFK